MFFTVEETNLMCCFDTSGRGKLIAEMKSTPVGQPDNGMAELIRKTIRKLEGTTDAEFEEYYIGQDSLPDSVKEEDINARIG